MALQEGQRRHRDTGSKAADTKPPEAQDAQLHGEAFEAKLSAQEEIFESRKEELLAKYPGMDIAVCGGDVFAANGPTEAAKKAMAAHPDEPVYIYGNTVLCTSSWV